MSARPTGAGWATGGTAGVLVALGVRFDYPEAVALGFCAAALLAFSSVWQAVGARIRATRVVEPNRVTAGRSVECLLRVHNAGSRTVPALEVTEVLDGRERRFALPPSRGRSTTRVHGYHLPTDRRGVYRLPPPVLTVHDPARLIRRRFATEGDTVIHVHPDHHPLTSPWPGGERLTVDGVAARPRGTGMAYYGLREYVVGDDSRYIHWPATARIGTLMVRHHGVLDTPGLFVLLDTTNLAVGEEFEDAVRVAASLAVSALRAGARLTLCTTDLGHVPDLGATPEARVTAVLDFLAGVEPSETVRPPRFRAPGAETATTVVVTTGPNAALSPGALVVRVDPDTTGPEVDGVLTVASSADFAAKWNNR
ncbi:DUF58 domain-containing protein [Actinokineospora auranticolor]|uniref:Uncharacterized protein (DUF58 family) n=1 Tax=Actinokineospora auranticolor TaxID=155976 RepID=A0A2S6H103_9PSEU|nr:DUF58 domain-containing protein [Actinokineospora auranticolor]PPK71096.1 uncharacterized protein (DUF58 family) [Actinokineospora auranticolor]